ncbi:MAG: gluconokinase [Bacteroidetes bacterium]|nr:gluconokinase [Bacteroidota bacterium]
MDYLIGIDIGTTHAKAVISDLKGKLINQIKDGYSVSESLPGYQEQSAEAVFQTVLKIITTATHSLKDKGEIKAIAFSAALHSIMAVDTKCQPLTPALTWADTRSTDYANQFRGTEKGNQIARLTGTPIHPMSPLCKIAWMRDRLPDIYKSAHKFISIKEYLFYHLFGEYVVDYSIASASGLFNNQDLCWLPEALEFAGIDASKLSKPVSPFYVLPALQKEYADRFGLSSSTLFIAGASDGPLANPGSGTVLPNELALTIGTSGAIRKLSSAAAKTSLLFSYLLDEKTYVKGGATNNGGNVIQWFIKTFTDLDPYDDEVINNLMGQAASIPEGSDGLVFLPYIHGERAPVWNADARGIFFGIQSHHTRAHFMRSILEGICFSLLQIMNLLENEDGMIEKVYASGGFTASKLWLKIMADILKKPVCVSYSADASAMGAIYMAMYKLGIINEWKEVKSLVIIDEEIFPDQSRNELYAKNYKVFCGLYDKLKDDF